MRKVLGVEVSKSAIKVVEISKKGKEMLISAMGEFNFASDLYQKKDSQSVAKSFKRFLALHKIEAKVCCMSLFSSEACFQESTIPENLSVQEMDELVQGNLERLFYFKEEQYLYAYNNHELKHRPGRKRILYTGINKELADFHLAVLNECQMVLEIMDITPLSLLSFFYSLEKNNEDEKLIVYLKQSISYVIAFKACSCRLLYVINRGLNDLKSVSGDSSSGSFEGISEEFRRTFKFYETEYKTRIRDVFLVGGKGEEDLSQTADKLSTYLKYRVSCLASYRDALSFAGTLDKDFDEGFLNAISVASMALYHRGHDFDIRKLWNRRYSVRALYKYLSGSLVVIAAIIILSMVPYFYFSSKNNWLIQRRQNLQDQVKLLQVQTRELLDNRSRLTDFKEEVKKQGVFISEMNSLSWSKTLEEIVKALPSNCWLNSFHLDENGKIKISGQSEALYYLTEFVSSLYDSPAISNIKLSSMKELNQGRVSFQLEMDAQ